MAIPRRISSRAQWAASCSAFDLSGFSMPLVLPPSLEGKLINSKNTESHHIIRRRDSNGVMNRGIIASQITGGGDLDI